jgi:ATP-dependent protease ClpP protease subunit
LPEETVPVEYSPSPAHEKALIAKLKAEEAELKYQQELRKAEIAKTLAEAQREEHEAAMAGIARKERQRIEDLTAVSDHFVFHHTFDGAVGANSVKICLQTMDAWHRQHENSEWTITMNSPGGSVTEGMHLFDALTAYSKRGGGTHQITMIVRGYAASMAAILLQAVDKRVIGPESYLLIHEISAAAIGKVGEMKDDMKWYEKICDRIATIFVQRSGGKISKGKFKANWTRKDWWLSSDEALALGFVDEVG